MARYDEPTTPTLENYRQWVQDTEPGTRRVWVPETGIAPEPIEPCRYTSLREMLLDWGYAR
jgi:hypothetical protein